MARKYVKTNFSKKLEKTYLKTFEKEFKISYKQWIMSASHILVWILQNDYEQTLNCK